jgi:hypothetical protein
MTLVLNWDTPINFYISLGGLCGRFEEKMRLGHISQTAEKLRPF